ncbi:uncharacterized protein ACLA_040540 [Aspergillus clavatus NRRL 1]|uniref:Uncharacterized protein n=1 Tax=Aspergillus clavatus (strain ATCC 1007 / CBS 513.65 / DSM 816 / NCTC 3887 / NRRL 1 / QM 1276 / 107) TaxID=344612 RepID=A1CL14_ASPCL|nr:uncharacterized protein ACLA_040540 [Aspergillus clavatus NRRL 1]EAW09838.1 hypothetical protein ACLA_040540 [Aspergillus clavatus NRRL 1]
MDESLTLKCQATPDYGSFRSPSPPYAVGLLHDPEGDDSATDVDRSQYRRRWGSKLKLIGSQFLTRQDQSWFDLPAEVQTAERSRRLYACTTQC